jgi:hypothetical protein
MTDGIRPPAPPDRPKRLSLKAVRPHDTRPRARDVQDRARLAQEVKGSLERIRKTAENWRTGMAGLTALVTASLLFNGRDSIVDYAPGVQYAIAAVALLSLVVSVASLWLFLTAAYGRLAPRSAQAILDGGGVDVHNVQLATAALRDLRLARRLGLGAAGLLAVALLISWFGPAARGVPASVRLVVASESTPPIETLLCGELQALNGSVAVIQVSGEPDARRIKTPQLVSMTVVASCTQPN